MDAIAKLLSEGARRHQAGDLAAAETIYRQMLQVAPENPDAWHLLGVVAHQQGNRPAAIERIQTAIRFSQPHPMLHFNLANVQLENGDLANAADNYKRAVELRPAFADAWLNRGAVCLRLEQIDEAAECFRQAIAAQPNFAEAHFNLALVCERQQRWDEALTHYAHALECDPQHYNARFNLAAGLARVGRLEEAKDHYQQLLDRQPNSSQVLTNFGTVLQEMGDVKSASEHYRAAIAADPNCGQAFYNLGLAQIAQQDYSAAVLSFEQTTRLMPRLPDGFHRLGDARLGLGQIAEAQKSFRQALAMRPRNLWWRLQQMAIGPDVFASIASIEQWRTTFAGQLNVLAGDKAAWDCSIDEISDSGCRPPMSLAYQGRNDRAIKEQFAEMARRGLPKNISPPQLDRSSPPRVGFVVTAGHEGIFLRGMAGVINRFSPQRVQAVVACATSALPKVKSHINSPDIEFVPLSPQLERAVEQLRQARLHVLYHWEIGTDCSNYFLPLFRCAAVQCASWGWPVTSGMSEVDYFLSSDLLEPPGADQHYTEKLIRLSRLPNYYSRPDVSAITADRKRFALPENVPLYVCGQNPLKMHPDFDQLLAGIMRSDPSGEVALVQASRPHVTALLEARMRAAMPDVYDRIRWIPRLGKDDYARLLASGDVVLDTPHYGGGANSTYDALALGKPVITLPGEFHRSRYAAAAYRIIGVDGCVTNSPEDYVARAVRLANDNAYRQEISSEILAGCPKLFDDAAAVDELQECLIEITLGAK